MEDGARTRAAGAGAVSSARTERINKGKDSPPPFKSNMTYLSWKKKIMLWTIVTGVKKDEQAIMVVLHSLDGQTKAEKVANEMKQEELHLNTGLKSLLTKLDNVYLTETVDEAYLVYTKFIQLSKTDSMSMLDYIIEFGHLYTKMEDHNMKLPEKVLTFKLLDGAMLDESQRQMALTFNQELTLEGMKSAMKRLFANCHGNANKLDEENPFQIKIKTEDTYFGTNNFRRKGKQHLMKKANEWKLDHLNPLDKYGNVSKCAICGSRMHWADKCQHKQHSRRSQNKSEWDIQFNDDEASSEEDDSDIINLMSLNINDVLISESCNTAIIDTGCAKTVCGQIWFDNYYADLSQNERKRVIISPSDESFKFGDGRIVSSIKSVSFPAILGKKSCVIRADVVPTSIPLLLSRKCMKEAKFNIDCANDTVTVSGNILPTFLSEKGHYCVNIHPRNVENNDCFVGEIDNKFCVNYSEKELIKIHKQFGHASVDNLIKLFKNANQCSASIVEKLKDAIAKCDICKVRKRPAHKPIVSLPWANNFNDCIAMDLHELGHSLWYIHFIDVLTRFSAAAIITTKTSSTIVKHFLQKWISIFGPPKRVISDNGLEFNNREFQDVCENFNITVVTTAAYAPWSNGIVERHNFTLTEILLKIKDDIHCDWSTALMWALSAKNSLINHLGFSPCQLVFGTNPNLPSTLHDQLPCLDGTSSMSLSQHISSLHVARKACIEAESSEKIRRALLKQTRSTGQQYVNGERVYYKRDNDKKWKGPATIVGQDGVVNILRHGGQIVRVHSCRVQPVNGHGNTRQEEICMQPKISTGTQTIVEKKHDYVHISTKS